MAGLLAQATSFFLGVSILISAAFVFQRSKRAALFVALAGLGCTTAVLLDVLMAGMWRTFGVAPSSMQFFYFLVNVGRHVVLFGGLAMGMRTIAVETP